MNTFERQYEQLSPQAQQDFTQRWGKTPWNDPTQNQPQQRMAWKAALAPLPRYPRWEVRPHRESPLWMALRAKNRRAANAILDKTDTLTRKEAANCVLLTLQWAPDLLERILDKTPGRPFTWLQHDITLDRTTQLTLHVRGSLVMIAAALNDLRALELLLRRGAHPDYDFHRDRWDIVGDLLMGGVTMGALNSPDYSLYRMELSVPFPDESSQMLFRADPLSAAIFGNAKLCALRLLEEPSVTVTHAVRRALALTPIRETQQAVAEQLDTPLEDLLLPEHFGPELDHPLLSAVLRRHGGDMPYETLKSMIVFYHRATDETTHRKNMEIFSLIDPTLLGDVVWEIWQQSTRRTELLELARALSLPVDRCRVPENLSRSSLTALLDHFHITGDPPEDGLSGLASTLLHQLEEQYRFRPLPVEQLMQLPGAAHVLETEHPEMILAWLAGHEDLPASQTLPLKSLLNIHKEVDYGL